MVTYGDFDILCTQKVVYVPVKTGSSQVLLGGPGGQGTWVEVSPDTSRAWATRRFNPGARESSLEFAEHFWSQDKSPEVGNCPRGSSIKSGMDMAEIHPLCEFGTC